MSVVGLDGCRKGWCCVELVGAQAFATVLHDIDQVWSHFCDSELLLIDIPIGLWDSGDLQRRCDKAARARLQRRHSSVFTPPLRAALEPPSYSEASACNYQLSGRKLSRQAWGIAPKIAEVDAFFASQPLARGLLRESHPEILFSCLNGGQPMSFGKKTPRGKSERQAILQRHYSATPELLASVRRRYLKRQVADDDVRDALVAAICASLCARIGLITLPAAPDTDARGLPMEIVLPALC